MTNKEFMKIMEIIHNCLRTDANNKFDLHPITKHAKKLIAVVEAASTVAKKLGLELDEDGNGAFYSTYCLYDVADLKTALEDLERE